MSKGTILMTGATGIMGSWVLGEALSRSHDVIAIMRDREPARAMERIKSVLAHVGRSGDLDRVEIIEGEAGKPNFGLSETSASAIRDRISGFIHCAACTSFSVDKNEECWATNVGGVEAVLDFLDGSTIPLYHVSTAYVAGRRRGNCLETELDVEQDFSNTYERSKCAAEKLVRAAFDSGRLKGAIFRPSIIVGSTQDGRILQFMNFYNLLRMIDLMASRKARGRVQIRMAVEPEGTKNIIPVDWAVKALWEIIENEGPSKQVYHLTNPRPVSHAQVQAWANTLMGDNHFRVELVEELETEPTSMEALVANSFSNYSPYLGQEPLFDRTNTERALRGKYAFPEMGPDQFEIFLDFARSVKWRSLFDSRAPKPAIKHAVHTASHAKDELAAV